MVEVTSAGTWTRRKISDSAGAECLILDSGVADARILLDGLRPGIEVVRLPDSDDPVAAIALALAGRRAAGLPELSVLHVLSHGAPGRLLLSGRMVDTAALAARPALLDTIRAALADDAEIVLYGCSVAEGADGAAFVERLSTLLGCRVAASEGPVGSADLGGSWDLPAVSEIAFAPAAQAAYPHALIIATFGVVTTINTTTTLTSNEGGVTLSATKSDGTTFNISSGFLNPGNLLTTSNVSYTVTFSTPVNVTQFQLGEFNNLSAGVNYVFTPNTGTAVTIADNSGSIVGAIATLNPGDWNGITSFTVSYADTTSGSSWRVGIDNINFTVAGPGVPSTPDLTVATDLGSSSTDNVTSSATQTFTGTSSSATKVHVLVDGTTVGTATPDAGGTWTFSTSLSAGSYAITAIGDDGSTKSSASTALNIVVDQTAPTTLAPPDLLAASDTGSSSTDNITNAATQQLSGSATTGDTVSILVGGVTAGTVTAAGGSWSYSTSLSAGSYAITVQATDTAGNAGAASSALGLTVDQTAPTTLAPPDLLAASDSGSSNTDNITNAATQQLSGSATAGDTVSILVGGVTVTTVTAAGGSWSYSASLSAGSYAITVSATDTAGNVGGTSSALGLTVDTTAPTTLDAPDLLAASDTGVSSTDNITSSATQQLSGSATTGSSISILVGGTTLQTVTAAGGSWSYTATLSAGSYAITVSEVDAAGNSGPASTALGVVIDTTAPTVTIGTPDLLASSDSGTSSTDNITNATLPTVSGTSAIANSLVHVLVGGVTVGSVTASAAGAWTYTLTSTLAAGTHTITALSEDTAGNDGPASAALNIVVDTAAPAAPSTLATPDLLASSDDGASNTDNITSVSAPTFSGTNTTGSSLHALLANGVTVGTFTSSAGGTYSVTASSLAIGSYAITIRELDSAGNASSDSPALNVVINAAAPDDSGGGGSSGGGGGTTSTTTTNTATAPTSTAIVQNTGNNGNLVTASVPASVTITSTGPATAQSGSDASTTLITAINNQSPSAGTVVVGNAQTFLNNLATTTQLDIRTIVPTLGTGVTTNDPIIITGSTGGSQSEAFVIDMRGVPGKTLQLDNIEFSSIIGNATVNGGAGNNYAVGDGADQFISLGEGDDTLYGGDGNDTIGSDTGDDSLFGEGGNDTVFGGTGNDSLWGGTGTDVVYGNQDADVLYGNQQDDTLYGGQDNDVLYGGQDVDIAYGNLADDVMYGNLGADSLYGGQGNDVLFGGQGNDLLVGGLGNDSLYGNLGDDTITTGSGADTVVVGSSGGADVVTDFDGTSGDRIQIAADVNDSGIDTFAELKAAATDTTDGVQIALGSGNTLTLNGITVDQLQSGWFTFG